MSLSADFLQQQLLSMKDNSKGAGDSIGVAITKYLNTMFPIIAGPLKDELDTKFIDTLNASTFLTPLPVILPTALNTYTLGLLPIIAIQNSGFVAIPPPISPESFITSILLSPQTKESFAVLFSTAIDNWFKTGTYSISGNPPQFWN